MITRFCLIWIIGILKKRDGSLRGDHFEWTRNKETICYLKRLLVEKYGNPGIMKKYNKAIYGGKEEPKGKG